MPEGPLERECYRSASKFDTFSVRKHIRVISRLTWQKKIVQ